MSDGYDPVALDALKAAAHPLRLSLLELAAKEERIHSRDAKRLAAQDPGSRSGGPQWHVGELERAGLIVRTRHGEYELAGKGARLLRSLGLDVAKREDQELTAQPGVLSVQVTADPPTLLPVGTRLVARLARESATP